MLSAYSDRNPAKDKLRWMTLLWEVSRMHRRGFSMAVGSRIFQSTSCLTFHRPLLVAPKKVLVNWSIIILDSPESPGNQNGKPQIEQKLSNSLLPHTSEFIQMRNLFLRTSPSSWRLKSATSNKLYYLVIVFDLSSIHNIEDWIRHISKWWCQ